MFIRNIKKIGISKINGSQKRVMWTRNNDELNVFLLLRICLFD